MEIFNFIIVTLFISVALGLDAFSVALGVCSYADAANGRQTFRLSSHFGLFHLLMTIFGWVIGSQVVKLIANYDHWVAFSILALFGVKLIFESNKSRKIQSQSYYTCGWKLISLSIATNIDALAVGFGISLLHHNIFIMALIIGLAAGILIGEHLSNRFERKSKVLVGFVLIGIGLQILLRHLDVI